MTLLWGPSIIFQCVKVCNVVFLMVKKQDEEEDMEGEGGNDDPGTGGNDDIASVSQAK